MINKTKVTLFCTGFGLNGYELAQEQYKAGNLTDGEFMAVELVLSFYLGVNFIGGTENINRFDGVFKIPEWIDVYTTALIVPLRQLMGDVQNLYNKKVKRFPLFTNQHPCKNKKWRLEMMILDKRTIDKIERTCCLVDDFIQKHLQSSD